MFNVKVNKNAITVTQKDTMTAGSVNVYPVQFEFNSADWDGLDRVAIFTNQYKTIQYLLDDSNLVEMPWELMTMVGSKISVGVYGKKGDNVVLPTQWGICGQVVEGVIPSGDLPSPPPSSGGGGTTDLSEIMKELGQIKASIPSPITAEELRDILTEEG